MGAPKTRHKRTLEREQVIAAALRVLESDGLDGLTVRRLAAELGVQNPALYWHFKNKQEIVDGLARSIVDESFTRATTRSGGWHEWLLEAASAFRASLMAHRDGARVVASADLSKSQVLERVEQGVGLLMHSGFTRKNALVGMIAVFDYALGATFEEQADPIRRPVKAKKTTTAEPGASIQRALKGVDTFSGGLQLILEGLRWQLRTRE